jgi:hypothetical protein
MNIVALVKQIVSEFPQISELNYGVAVDFTEQGVGNCGLYPTGDQLLKEDILGNQDRQHNFVLYANFNGFNDYDRMANSTFLLDLAYWLEKAAKEQEVMVNINEQIVSGTLKKLSSANGMLYGYHGGTMASLVTYQLQIYAQYHLESEGL